MILRKTTILIVSVLIIVSCITLSKAHVPYIERYDFTVENPCTIWKMLEKSKAFYCWLEYQPDQPCTDIDIFQFSIRQRPINVYIELIVPVVQEYYEDFVPWFALVGPDLPQPSYQLPFDLPIGYGALVIENQQPGSPRDSFYEPFGGKSYYYGPILDMNISQPGTYYVYVWDPYESGGDYVLVLGKGEFFGPIDILRAIINTIIIRQDKELHVPSSLVVGYNNR